MEQAFYGNDNKLRAKETASEEMRRSRINKFVSLANEI
jgi:hypothetical protein